MSKDPISSQFQYHPDPTVVPSSQAVPAEEWKNAVDLLLLRAGGVSITPYVAKCLYFVGTVRHVVDAASILYETKNVADGYNLPAYLLACSVVELFGRCIEGHPQGKGRVSERLKSGFGKVFEVSFKRTDKRVLTSAVQQGYSIDDLISLRHFGAHGFAGTEKTGLTIDRQLIGWLLGAIGKTLNCYFNELKTSETLSKNMAAAGISPLFFQGQPIHIAKIYRHLKKGGNPGAPLCYEKYWVQEYDDIMRLNEQQASPK